MYQYEVSAFLSTDRSGGFALTSRQVDTAATVKRLDRAVAEDLLFADEDLSTEGLADVMDMHSGQLSGLLNNVVGVDFRQYVNEHRVDAAKRLLTEEPERCLFRIYPNHRMVNHSKRSADKRFRYAENGSIKSAMRAYNYFKPEFSSLYLNEWAFFRNLRYFGIERLAEFEAIGANGGDERMDDCVDGEIGIKPRASLPIHTIPPIR